MRSARILSLALSLLFGAGGAHAVDGVTEINHASILASGGYPFSMPASGSYVLTGNLTPPLGTSALVAGGDDIEVDLNGFQLVSPGGGGVGVDSGGFGGLTVRRGTIRGFDGTGIVLGSNGRVLDVTLSANGIGIDGAFGCLIVHNVVNGSAGTGIIAEFCKIENNVIAGNGGGIVGAGNVIVHNEIVFNMGGGITDTGGCTIQQNVITSNMGAGITDGMPFGGLPPVPPPAGFPPRSDVMGNVIDNNFAGPGIGYDTPALITDNTVTNSFADGVKCGASCTVRGNVVDTNNLGGAGTGGVVVADGSTVHANSISFNTGVGLTLPCTSGYTNNTITSNTSGVDVALVACVPPTVTGGAGNNCSGGACP